MGSNGYTSHKWSITLGQKWTWKPEIISCWKFQLDLGWPWDTLRTLGVFEVQNQAPSTHVPYELYRIWTTRNIQEKSIMKIQLDLGISSGFSRYRIRHPIPMSLMSSTEYEPPGTFKKNPSWKFNWTLEYLRGFLGTESGTQYPCPLWALQNMNHQEHSRKIHHENSIGPWNIFGVF